MVISVFPRILILLLTKMVYRGFYSLIDAARAGDVGEVRVTIAKSADVNAMVQTGTTALMAAAAGGYDGYDIARILRKAGAAG